jgi:hypothetical protein
MRTSAVPLAIAASVASLAVAASTGAAQPPGRIATAHAQGGGQITLWRSADGSVIAAIPTSAIRFGLGPAGWGLVRGSTVSHGGGVDTPPVAVTYHDAASLARGAAAALFGLAPRTRRAAFSAGHPAARPRWVVEAMQVEHDAPTHADDWATNAAGFSRVHPGAWWVGAAAFGAPISDLQWYRSGAAVGGAPLDPPDVALQVLYGGLTTITTTRSQRLASLPEVTWQPTIGTYGFSCVYLGPAPDIVDTCVLRIGPTIIRIEASNRTKQAWLEMLGQLAPMS